MKHTVADKKYDLPLQIQGNLKTINDLTLKLRKQFGYWPHVQVKGMFNLDPSKPEETQAITEYFTLACATGPNIVFLPGTAPSKVLLSQPVGLLDAQYLPEPHPQ